MATRSYIRVILKEEDRNRDMKFNPEMIKIENTWGDEQLDIEPWTNINPNGKAALMIYHHWDGYPDGVGETLLSEYNDYDKALNLVLGGDVSTINDKYAPMLFVRVRSGKTLPPRRWMRMNSLMRITSICSRTGNGMSVATGIGI